MLPQRRQSARHRQGNQHLHQPGIMVVVDVRTKCPPGTLHRPVDQPLAREELEDGKKGEQKRVDHESPAQGRSRQNVAACPGDGGLARPRPTSGLGCARGCRWDEKLPSQEKQNQVGGKLQQRFPSGNGIHREVTGELDHPQKENETGGKIERRPGDSQTALAHAGNRPREEQEKRRHCQRSPCPRLDRAKGQWGCEQRGQQRIARQGESQRARREGFDALCDRREGSSIKSELRSHEVVACRGWQTPGFWSLPARRDRVQRSRSIRRMDPGVTHILGHRRLPILLDKLVIHRL